MEVFLNINYKRYLITTASRAPYFTDVRSARYAPLNLEQYLDLVRRAVETRNRIHGDVEVTHHDDDGAYVHLRYAIRTSDDNLGRAFGTIQKITAEIEVASRRVGGAWASHRNGGMMK